jgi:hypothetical protein
MLRTIWREGLLVWLPFGRENRWWNINHQYPSRTGIIVSIFNPNHNKKSFGTFHGGRLGRTPFLVPILAAGFVRFRALFTHLVVVLLFPQASGLWR